MATRVGSDSGRTTNLWSYSFEFFRGSTKSCKLAFDSDGLLDHSRRRPQAESYLHRDRSNHWHRRLQISDSSLRGTALRLLRRRAVLSSLQPASGLGLRRPATVNRRDHVGRAVALW